MFIQKVFHVHHDLKATRAHLGRLPAYRRHLEGFHELLLSADGVAQFACTVRPGFRLHGTVAELPHEEPDAVLFASTAGNLALQGLVSFRAVRPAVTEVQVTLNYQPLSRLAWLSELFTRNVERFLERQLRALQGCLDGTFSHSPQAVSAARAMSHLPQLAN